MTNDRKSQVPVRTAAELSTHINLRPESRALLGPNLSPRAFFDRLMERAWYGEAIRFLPHVLPNRAALWWGCLCAWSLDRPVFPEPEAAALEAALAWVMDPGEENRRAAEKPGRMATLKTPAGCLALAAFWSGGSMVGPELPVIAPPVHATPRLVGGAILLAVLRRAPLEAVTQFRSLLHLGQEIARGRNLWTESGLRECPVTLPVRVEVLEAARELPLHESEPIAAGMA